MSKLIFGGNQHKAERIAREMVKDLTLADLEWVIVEGTTPEADNRICAAVHDDFLKNERRINQLEKIIDSKLKAGISKLFEEYNELVTSSTRAHEKASFTLGYAAAHRLLGVDPKPKGKRR
jgi:hypothetical protein